MDLKYPLGAAALWAVSCYSIMNVKLRELSVEERIKLVEALWDSIAEDRKALPITPLSNELSSISV
jgi:uncharacterized tellurite resistance protein B-like protein